MTKVSPQHKLETTIMIIIMQQQRMKSHWVIKMDLPLVKQKVIRMNIPLCEGGELRKIGPYAKVRKQGVRIRSNKN